MDPLDAFMKSIEEAARADAEATAKKKGKRQHKSIGSRRKKDRKNAAGRAANSNKGKSLQDREREKGLKKVIDKGIGFKLMQKMGYKAGSGLGKEGKGITEPVGLNLKLGRGGLGQEEEKKRKQEARTQASVIEHRTRVEEQASMQSDFQQQQSAAFALRNLLKQIKNARLAIESLDVRRGLERHRFWTPEPGKEEDREHSESDTAYTHGNDSDKDTEHTTQNEKDYNEEDAKSVESFLLQCLRYLRDEHFYCFFCASSYSSPYELATQCPGITEDVH